MDNLRELPRQWVNIIRYGNELGPSQEQHTTLVHKSVEMYRSFYDLPDSITDRAKNVGVHIVTRHQLDSFISREMRREHDIRKHQERWDPKLEAIEREGLDINIKLTQYLNKQGFGFTIPFRDRVEVLISQEQNEVEKTIDHEVLHVLSSRGLGQGDGLQSGTEVFYPGERSEGLVVNEAMTEALRLVASNPDLSVAQINDLVAGDKIWFGYKDKVKILFGLLTSATGNSESPFDVKAQAPLYFGFDGIRSVDARRQFIANLEGSLSEEERRLLHTKLHFESQDFSTIGDLKPETNVSIYTKSEPDLNLYIPFPKRDHDEN